MVAGTEFLVLFPQVPSQQTVIVFESILAEVVMRIHGIATQHEQVVFVDVVMSIVGGAPLPSHSVMALKSMLAQAAFNTPRSSSFPWGPASAPEVRRQDERRPRP